MSGCSKLRKFPQAVPEVMCWTDGWTVPKQRLWLLSTKRYNKEIERMDERALEVLADAFCYILTKQGFQPLVLEISAKLR